MEHAMATLAAASTAHAPTADAHAPTADGAIEVPECIYYKHSEKSGFVATEVSAEVVKHCAERWHNQAVGWFEAAQFTQAASGFSKAAHLMLRASLRFHVGAELAVRLDATIPHAWALHSQALFIQNQYQKARASAFKALQLDPTNKEYATLALDCIKLAQSHKSESNDRC